MGRATVYIDQRAVLNGSVDVVSALERIPRHQITMMQQIIAEHAHCMHYSEPPVWRHVESALIKSMKSFRTRKDQRPRTPGNHPASREVDDEHTGLEWMLSDRSMLNSADDAFDIMLKASWRLSQEGQASVGGVAVGRGEEPLCQRVQRVSVPGSDP
uniref:Uncharacterized protein n=1 Tax=Prymnesium polylepis TaxID=72548 RepID=A0A7S4IEM4_9EUKA|mmetsp:Transcript_30607/g.75310  ORF Transcript_30607/g.75310 Transcript_30607/m.75310 type:complete len:157 (+) Transcript_30607:266-736(+)|eukprot:3417705-Prymnesium_polylepis.2